LFGGGGWIRFAIRRLGVDLAAFLLSNFTDDGGHIRLGLVNGPDGLPVLRLGGVPCGYGLGCNPLGVSDL
jgi:hypothetical protein